MAKLKLHKISKVEANIEGQQVEKLTAAAVQKRNNSKRFLNKNSPT